MNVVNNGNLKIAVQKKGRLTEKSIELLKLCGIEIENYAERLVVSSASFPIDILFLRDDDIPEYVQDGVADLGIVGENVLCEKGSTLTVLEKLQFGKCRIMIAAPERFDISKPEELEGKTIATSYPKILQSYLDENRIIAKIIELSGSVEIAPALGVADAICDIVSTGNTLMMNKLKKAFAIFESQAVLVSSPVIMQDEKKAQIVRELSRRIRSVLSARHSKYLMMNVPKSSVAKITSIIPSLKSPTILPLADPEQVALHAVIPTGHLWNMVDELKQNGATGILLLPIENMIE
ncbi:MAG: ATP phosphoribosyltransferase [Ignavibacteriales bacterium]|nr:ATP phosphoribosyltransferase [Ignavibacteriales bacterium]